VIRNDVSAVHHNLGGRPIVISGQWHGYPKPKRLEKKRPFDYPMTRLTS
jgi:hypothetical protein